MELLYNPDRMPEEEIKATFVAREALVDTLVELIKGQPDGAGVQHAVIIAPRGMGKTTVLLMVKFAIKDRGLADQWQAVKFPEESYGIYDLADLWVETLYLIAADTADTELRRLADTLKTKYPNNDELQEAAYAALKDWRRKHGRRLLLLVENFDQILEQINDERDNARLRDVMMNDGTLMLLGGATTFFKEARAYDQPLYNFFKIYNLHDLKFAQMQELLSRRATVDRVADFETSLRQNEGRLRVLEYFTGGSPRLVLMLYRVVTQSNVDEVRRALEKLLDEVTPYYKAKIEMLSPQQRKILDHIARVSGQTNEGLTPKEIAEAVRLPQNQVSAQLKRLSELDYVRAANLRGRSSFYILSEPLYAIWHQMRFGRNARERMNWLVSFLKVWYAAEEMGAESERLDQLFQVEVKSNHPLKARNLLEHHRYLTEAMESLPLRTHALERVIRGYLELKDAATIKSDLLSCINLADLSNETLDALLAAGCINPQEIVQAIASNSSLVLAPEVMAFLEVMAIAFQAYREERHEEALQRLNHALQLKPKDEHALTMQGEVLNELGRYEEAITSFNHVLEIQPDKEEAWFGRGNALTDLGGLEEAAASYDRALEIKPDNVAAWVLRGLALESLGRYEEALASFERAIEVKPEDDTVWFLCGNALVNLSQYEKAVASYDRALEVRPENDAVWFNRGVALWNLGRYAEALASYDRVLEIDPNFDTVWFNRGFTCLKWSVELAQQEKFDAAREKWNEALVSGGKSNDEDWPEEVTETLLEVAKTGHLGFTRQLIVEAGMEEQLFPLARAIDYLQTGDEALIEKLSPEVRGIVEEVVAKLRTTTASE